MAFIQNSSLKKLFNICPKTYIKDSERCGILYIKGTKETIPLQSISYEVEILDSLAFIRLTQNYFNSLPHSIETEFFFSIAENACFYEFQAEIDGQIMLGKIKEKQEAKDEYEQNKAQGNLVAYSETNKDVQDIMKINIGNVPPNKPIKITYGFLQELDICLNKFWKLLIPATLTPRYLNETNNNNNNPSTMYEYQNFNFPQITKSYQWSITAIINSMTEVSFIRSPTHDITITNLDNFSTKFQIQLKNSETPNKDFVLLFRNKAVNQTKISLAEIDDEENPYCAMINFMPEFNPSTDEDAYQAFQKNSAKTNYEVNLLNSKGEYIFLLDRSGSMNGPRIEMAKKALLLFLKSLPPDSYFNIIGFGSTYETFYPTSLKTNENLISNALNKISQFDANLGGTEIYDPLKVALNSVKFNQYPKNIFILTDGDVGNVVSILTLIAQKNDLSRVYTIGIGNGCSREIIVEGAKIGKGKHEFIADNEDMNEKIIGLLEDSITPFLCDFKMSYDSNLINIIAPLPESVNYIRKNEEFRMFAFLNKQFSHNKQTFIQLQYYDSYLKKEVTQQIGVYINDLVIKKDYIHKYGAFQMIKRIQSNLNYERDFKSDIYLAKKDNLDTYCLNFALKYQILTSFTSFICVIKQNNNDSFLQLQTEKIIIPVIKPIQAPEKTDKKVLTQHCFLKGSRGGGNMKTYGAKPSGQNNLFELASSGNALGQNNLFSSRGKAQGFLGGKAPEKNLSDETCFSSAPSRKFDNLSTATFSNAQLSFQSTQSKPEPWLALIEKQKLEGFWDLNSENAIYIGKEYQKVKDLLPNVFSHCPSLWMTCLVLFFLENFQKEKMGSFKLIWKKAEQWMKTNGFEYQLFKETARKFYFGAGTSAKQIALIKQCQCGKTLDYVKEIQSYNGDFFCCDKCGANNFITGGVFHCEGCQYDLCEECNNDLVIQCDLCQKALIWMTKIPMSEYGHNYWCDVCTKEKFIKEGVYHCSGCGKYDMCLNCKTIR